MNPNPQGYRSPVVLSRFAMIAVGVVGMLDVFAGIVGVVQIFDPARTIDIDGGDGLSLWLMFQSLIALCGFAALIAAIVLFLVWLHRAYANLSALRSESNEFSPGWAIGWWFIPFANLVKPYQVMRSLWAESDPDVDLEMGFLTSVQAGAPGFMMVWWVLWLLSNFASNVTARVFDPSDIRSVEISGYFFIVAGILRGVAAALAIKVVHEITERQEQRFARIGSLAMEGPPPPPTFDRGA